MRFFLDHCVPVDVGRVLKDAGHEVIVQTTAIAADSPDPLVQLTAVENDAILVSFDPDHHRAANRFGISNKRFRKLSRIHLRCSEPHAAVRVKLALSFIEHEWQIALSSQDKRMFLEIQGNGLKTVR